MTDQNIPQADRTRKHALPDIAWLRARYRYDAATGTIHGARGTPVGSLRENGYLHISVTGNGHARHIPAHRLAWALTHGHWPTGVIDHINRVRNDNRLENLRDVTPKQNSWNRPPGGLWRSVKTDGRVLWHASGGKTGERAFTHFCRALAFRKSVITAGLTNSPPPNPPTERARHATKAWRKRHTGLMASRPRRTLAPRPADSWTQLDLFAERAE